MSEDARRTALEEAELEPFLAKAAEPPCSECGGTPVMVDTTDYAISGPTRRLCGPCAAKLLRAAEARLSV